MFSGRPCEKEGYFRYKNSCTHHYRCYYNKKCGKIIPSRVYECPGCLKFHTHKMICDLPENVPECTYHDDKFQNVEGHTLTDPIKYCTGPGIFLDPSNRKRYFDCIDIFHEHQYYLTIKDCQMNTTFSDSEETCIPEVHANLPAQRYVPSTCNSYSYAVDQYNCNKFYYCRKGVPFAQLSCMSNYFFNGKFCQHKSRSMFCNWELLKKSFKKQNVDLQYY